MRLLLEYVITLKSNHEFLNIKLLCIHLNQVTYLEQAF
jgi:hypothetical protein